MSHSPLNAARSPSPDSSPATTHEVLAALAATLQEAARVLLVLSPANVPEEPEKPATKRSARQDPGETRSYYFPPGTADMERELLRKYRAEDFQGLLEEAHALLVGLVSLMKNVHKEARVRGHVITSLGKQVEHASALVLRMRNVYGRVMPVQP